MRQAYMSTPRTETTPPGARTPVGGPPTEMQMLTLMQPQNRHMIPESTPGAQAKLQDDDGRPRLMGYYDTQREYEEGCALNMSQGNLIWITIRKIRPSDITEVLEHLTEQGDHEGNRWVIETTHTAWMGNICISKSAASAWLSIVMLTAEFDKLNFIHGVYDLDRGSWQGKKGGLYAEVDQLYGMRGAAFHAIVQIMASGQTMAVEQTTDVETARLFHRLTEEIRRKAQLDSHLRTGIRLTYRQQSKCRIAVMYCENKLGVHEANTTLHRTQTQRNAPIKIRIDGLSYQLTSFDVATAAKNPQREAQYKKWEIEDEQSQGRKIVISGINVQPTPAAVQQRLLEHAIAITDIPRITKSLYPDDDGTPLWRAFFTVEHDSQAAWLICEGADAIKMGGRKVWIKASTPRKEMSERKMLNNEEKNRIKQFGPTDGLTPAQLAQVNSSVKQMSAEEVEQKCKAVIAHWERTRAEGGIDPTSHSAELYNTVTSLTGRVELLETNMDIMKGNLDTVYDMAADAQDRVKLIESQSVLDQQTTAVSASRVKKLEAQAAKDKRDIASILRAMEAMALQTDVGATQAQADITMREDSESSSEAEDGQLDASPDITMTDDQARKIKEMQQSYDQSVAAVQFTHEPPATPLEYNQCPDNYGPYDDDDVPSDSDYAQFADFPLSAHADTPLHELTEPQAADQPQHQRTRLLQQFRQHTEQRTPNQPQQSHHTGTQLQAQPTPGVHQQHDQPAAQQQHQQAHQPRERPHQQTIVIPYSVS